MGHHSLSWKVIPYWRSCKKAKKYLKKKKMPQPPQRKACKNNLPNTGKCYSFQEVWKLKPLDKVKRLVLCFMFRTPLVEISWTHNLCEQVSWWYLSWFMIYHKIFPSRISYWISNMMIEHFYACMMESAVYYVIFTSPAIVNYLSQP